MNYIPFIVSIILLYPQDFYIQIKIDKHIKQNNNSTTNSDYFHTMFKHLFLDKAYNNFFQNTIILKRLYLF